MITTSTRVEDAKLHEMLAACEGVTPGLWMVRDSCVFTKDPGRCVARLDWDIRDERDDANAAHIANCDPDTIRSILSELLELREAVTWRSMDSAPLNGTEVLLRVKSRAGIPDGHVVGHFMQGGHCIEDHPPIARGWYFWGGLSFDFAAEPTAWRPLRSLSQGAGHEQ